MLEMLEVNSFCEKENMDTETKSLPIADINIERSDGDTKVNNL